MNKKELYTEKLKQDFKNNIGKIVNIHYYIRFQTVDKDFYIKGILEKIFVDDLVINGELVPIGNIIDYKIKL